MLFGLAFLGSANAAQDTSVLMIDKIKQSQTIAVPNRGLTMDEVRASFGEPSNIKGPVGQPPITVWEYPDYNVYLEQQYVIDSVVHFKPKT